MFSNKTKILKEHLKYVPNWGDQGGGRLACD